MYSYLDHCTIWCKSTTNGLSGSTCSKKWLISRNHPVTRLGVEGATLEKTAGEAGLDRVLIRHNVGNKDDLLDAFLDCFDSVVEEPGSNLSSPGRRTMPVDWKSMAPRDIFGAYMCLRYAPIPLTPAYKHLTQY